jgi:hypothetical protein
MGNKPVGGYEVENGLTGFATYLFLRDDMHVQMPIVFVTVVSRDNIEGRIFRMETERGFKTVFIKKPCRPSELLYRVNELIEASREGGTHEET